MKSPALTSFLQSPPPSPLLHLLKVPPLMRFRAHPTLEPAHPILDKLLNPRPELLLMQIEIIHRPNPQHTLPLQPGTHPAHQRPTHRTEVVRHRVARRDGFGLLEFSQLLPAPDVLDGRVGDDEVGREARGRDLAAVGAVADERVDQVRAGRRLGENGVSCVWPWGTGDGVTGRDETYKG